MHNKKTQGFSLIEILLVIAIIAIILSLSLVMLRKQAQSTRINKSALEMQNVLQAAISYINQTGAWPQAYSCNTGNAPDPDFLGFLPNNDYQSNFGSNFCWSRDGSTQRFWVALPLPGANYKSAQQIAAQLPNAYAIKDPNSATPRNNLCDGSEPWCYVRAEVTQAAANPTGGVAATGYCKPSSIGTPQHGSANSISCTYLGADDVGAHYQIRFPCTVGEGNVVATPDFLTMIAPLTSDRNRMDPQLYKLGVQNDSCTTTDGNTLCTILVMALSSIVDKNTSQHISVTSQIDGYQPGRIGASFVAYCYQ